MAAVCRGHLNYYPGLMTPGSLTGSSARLKRASMFDGFPSGPLYFFFFPPTSANRFSSDAFVKKSAGRSGFTWQPSKKS